MSVRVRKSREDHYNSSNGRISSGNNSGPRLEAEADELMLRADATVFVPEAEAHEINGETPLAAERSAREWPL